MSEPTYTYMHMCLLANCVLGLQLGHDQLAKKKFRDRDSKIDKSALHGFNYPVGSWVACMKIENEDVWSNYIKDPNMAFRISRIQHHTHVDFGLWCLPVLCQCR